MNREQIIDLILWVAPNQNVPSKEEKEVREFFKIFELEKLASLFEFMR